MECDAAENYVRRRAMQTGGEARRRDRGETGELREEGSFHAVELVFDLGVSAGGDVADRNAHHVFLSHLHVALSERTRCGGAAM